MELGGGRRQVRIPILYEDRATLAIDKPSGWMLAPYSWQRTGRNLAAAVLSSVHARDHWARSRNLRFLRHAHRLDAETTGILLMVKHPGAMKAFKDLFESRAMGKTYLAVCAGNPVDAAWECQKAIAPDPNTHGRMKIAPSGKEAVTLFRLLAAVADLALVEARPLTGRTHQIRLHLAAVGLPILGDQLYGSAKARHWRHQEYPLALRAIRLEFRHPFLRRQVCIEAPQSRFLAVFGWALAGGNLCRLAADSRVD